MHRERERLGVAGRLWRLGVAGRLGASLGVEDFVSWRLTGQIFYSVLGVAGVWGGAGRPRRPGRRWASGASLALLGRRWGSTGGQLGFTEGQLEANWRSTGGHLGVAGLRFNWRSTWRRWASDLVGNEGALNKILRGFVPEMHFVCNWGHMTDAF